MSYSSHLMIEQDEADALFGLGEGEWKEMYG